MGSFSFRLACYDQFGWTPKDVRELPESEAALLAIYFEESGAYQAQQARDAKRRARADDPPGEWETVENLTDDEDDDE